VKPKTRKTKKKLQFSAKNGLKEKKRKNACLISFKRNSDDKLVSNLVQPWIPGNCTLSPILGA